jgi:N-acetylmuramoyl-L-alanine amidase
MATIVIDAGHGGASVIGHSSPNNATGPQGTQEKSLTLDLAIRMAEVLNQAGQHVLLTRNSDMNLDLRDRAAVARNNHASAFISIHFNGDANPAVQGTETWVHSVSSDDSRLLASSLQQQVVAVTGYTNRGVKSKGLGVLSLAFHDPTTAACLVEVSFLTNANDEIRLQNVNYKKQLAAALAQAVVDHLNGSTSIHPIPPVPSGDPAGEADA